jgi:hypothetical protein
VRAGAKNLVGAEADSRAVRRHQLKMIGRPSA